MLFLRRTAVTCVAWTPLLVVPASVWFASSDNLPPWGFMWLMAFALYAALKWLSWCDVWLNRTVQSAWIPAWKHMAYLLAWPGMDARAFLTNSSAVIAPSSREWFAAAIKLGCGAALISTGTQIGSRHELLSGWIVMVGLVLMLHCGLFHILSCRWRAAGVDARPLMNSPILSTSVSEFWGHRWNTAFRDLTHRFVFRPLAAHVGGTTALIVGFVLSGLVHELAITIPARAGYGGPTTFFGLQAIAIFVEKAWVGRRLGLGRGAVGWLFTACVLIAPASLLFPPAFVREVIIPFGRILIAD
jgi:hypothetical protein